MSLIASFQRVWETLRCSICDRKNEQLLKFHIITPQIPTCKAPNRFQESYNVRHFKVIKRLKSLQKAEAYLKPRRVYYLTDYYFCNKSSITDIQASENIEIFKLNENGTNHRDYYNALRLLF